MRIKILAIAITLLVGTLASAAFAQPWGPGNEPPPPGPGYGMGPGGGYGYGPGYGQGMGPGMRGPGWGHGYGMGPGMMGPGYGWDPGMMGPRHGYGPGWRWEEPELDPEEREARAKAFVEEYIRRYLPGYRLQKLPSQEE